MIFPLTISDISLLLAAVSIILLITSELLYSSPGYAAKIPIDRQVLRMAAVGFGLAFGLTVVMRMLGMV